MENLLTINKTRGCEDALDLDDFFQQRLTPVLQKLKTRLSHFESDSKQRLQDYTIDKIKRTYSLLESLDKARQLGWKQSLDHMNSMPLLRQTLEQSLADLTEKYRELETLVADDYFEKTLDDTMDAVMFSIEQVDNQISDTFQKASEMRNRVHEKIHDLADMAHDQLKKAIAYGAKRLLHYEELPVPWRNNKYILTGYRFLSTPADCFHSLLYIHNETGNIYTHLVGFFFFLSIGIYELFYSSLLSEVPNVDRIIFAIFFLAACKCLMCSTVWHTLSGINDYHTFTRMACLDYVGISVLICASIILCEYYGFYCHDAWRNSYIIGTGTLAIVGITMPFMSWFDKLEFRWIRIAFFICLASSGIVPIAHLSAVHGGTAVMTWIAPVVQSLLCYILGVAVYANQLPEVFWPGKFDHFGHSHQLWHLFVCGGIWFHYVAAKSFVSDREQFGFCQL
ncbi:hemolysin-III related-domain-containing protein [Radiomyces spectabilis]|uniref:hemolysin-III related-domain-containing protein n=1 Tax=Radiomyces spectabilis TaxID=64574 RepID=UPI0022203FDC|nr:hemolysin-III related-domain-containing protein [Radiomyces spectabilis]KAI8374620.1 hemolysin-III related-domain-containing protein [Radiomyces spectabilis]